MEVSVNDVSFSVQTKQIISDVNLRAKSGQIVGIIGPNGSGKSTILKNIYRVYEPDTGIVMLDDEQIKKMNAKKIAQKMAVVSQDSSGVFDFSVREIVLMGRAPHKKLLESDTKKDEEITDEALQKVGLSDYGNRSIMTLSGGERQRVMVARALTQKAQVLILDEPTNHLDIHHQLQLMDLVKTLDVTVITALHDLNMASVYCDWIYVMDEGKVVMSGEPETVLTTKTLENVFRVHTHIVKHPVTNHTHITFLSSTTS